ncbi:hypothetical protein RAS2_35430 [Phycisphaerae bacterium RAS2]|nr:hypothetical protein RAS2_35430 [Phycisphaerae bacterium RAS2]
MLAAALFGAAAMLFIQSATPYVSGNDSFYHLAMARMLPHEGFIKTFPWLHWTLFRDEFVSHHHGFHMLLSPLVHWSDRITGEAFFGGKAAALLAMGAAAGMLVHILRRLRVRHRWFWVLALACLPWHFWLRHSFIRAPLVGLPLMMAALPLVLRRRYKLLALLGFVFVHVYGGAVVFLLIPLAAAGAEFAAGHPWRTVLAAPIASSIGILFGLVLHPYFPANFRFLYTQLFETGLGAPSESGIEWKPYSAMFFLGMSWPLLAALTLCSAARIARRTRITRGEMILLLTNLAFFALTCKSRRFIEYWPVFCVLHAAYLFDRATRGPAPLTARLAKFGRAKKLACCVLIAAGAVVGGYANLLQALREARPGANVHALHRAMEYLKKNSPANSLVLTDDWDIFPYCFYYNQHNVFAVGLDPVFTSRPYPALWARYRAITRGKTPTSLPADVAGTANAGSSTIAVDDIATEFGAKYVMVCSDHPALGAKLDERPDLFTCVYILRNNNSPRKDAAVRIYQVGPTATTSPSQ